MPWDAKLTVVGADKDHSLPSAAEPGRHRRGEIVSIKDWTGRPHTAGGFGTLVAVYVTGIPDAITLEQAQQWLCKPHERAGAGLLTVKDVSGAYQVGETVDEPGGASATVDTMTVKDDLVEMDVSGLSGVFPDTGTTVTGQTSGAGGAFVSIEFEFLARKKRVIPVSLIPVGVRNEILNTGATTVTWTQIKNFIKRRPDNQTWDNLTDASALDDDEVLP